MNINRLSVRIGFFAMLISIVLGLFFSVLELYFKFEVERLRILTSVEKLIESSQSIATQAVFDYDVRSASNTLNGFQGYEYVIGGVIQDEFGEQIALFQAPITATDVVWRPLNLETEVISVALPLPGGGDPGMLGLTVDIELGLQAFYFSASRAIGYEFFKFSLLGLIFYLISVRYLAGPIKYLSDYLGNATPGSMPPPMELRRQKDEFGQLANSAFVYLLENFRYAERLGDAQSELQGVLDTVADALISIDENGFIHFSNVSASKMFRATQLSTQLRGKEISELIPSAVSHQNTMELFLSLGGGGTGNKGLNNLEVSCLRLDGEKFPAELTVGIYKQHDIPYVICTIKDLTQQILAKKDKNELESRLNQSQKLEAVGQLAGGIAHDFNNILTIILGNVELAQIRLGKYDDEKLNKYIDVIDRSTDRGVQLTKQLLIFSRGEAINPQLINVNESIVQMKDLLARLTRDDIKFEFELGDVKNILVDAGQFDQILLNLVKNASDAMSGQGKISVTTETVNARELKIMSGNLKQSHAYICVSVTDSGHGMSADTKLRLFEPFFTTKPVGQGTGLGLATIFGIVKNAGGQVEVESEEGHGATFKVYFPLHDASWTEVSAPEEMQLIELSGTILLCEDDEQIRELARTFLSEAGATVVTADTSPQAVELARDLKELSVLVTDVVMPEMNGREVYEAISRFRDVEVVYVSGYTADVLDGHGINEYGSNFLAKPYSSTSLIKAVRSIIH